jgi:hypothetical protein
MSMRQMMVGRLVALGVTFMVSGCLGSYPNMSSADGGASAKDGGGGGGGGGGGKDGGGSGDGVPTTAKELCSADFNITGTWVQGSAPPADFPGGCWPDGTWTFTTAVTNNTCPTAPKLEAEYVFKVVEDLDYNDTITYVTDPNNMYVTTKISGGEGAICTGAFLIFSADGKTVVNLRPALQTGNILNGVGDYRVWDQDQRN